MVADRLAVELLIGTALLNKYVVSILCRDQKTRFRNVEVPIVKQFLGGSDNGLTPFAVKHWTKSATRQVPN